MSNSSLVNYIHISPNKTSPRKHAIDTITIHHMAGDLSVETCGNVFAPKDRQASCNYGIGSDGRIGMYVEEKDRSWCSSSSSNDHRAITIEVANDGKESTGWHVSDKALNSLINLCADICKRNNIKKLLWKADSSLVGDVSQQNMTVHRWFAPTQCPGDYLYNKHSYIASEVNKKLNGSYTGGNVSEQIDDVVQSTKEDSSVTTVLTSQYSYINPMSLVDASKLTPYIATLGPDVDNVDYTKLKSEGVVGVMLYGGSYYTSSHLVKDKYINQLLKSQASNAAKSNMPYGLYVDVRATSVSEAKLECNQLWYVISKYPPQLGIWLRIETRASTRVNNEILSEYYKYIVKWGMKDNCGLYLTRKGLSYISWDDFYDDYLLWLVDPVTDVALVDDKLLTPEFYMHTQTTSPSTPTTSNKIQEFVSEALKHVGEGASWTWSTFGHSNIEWCAAFVCAVSKTVRILDKCIYDTASAAGLARQGVELNYGQFYTGPGQGRVHIPSIGDLVFFRWSNGSRRDKYDCDHVGIVVDVDNSGSTIVTVEGNTGSNSMTASKVNKKTYTVSSTSISGYFHPNWALAGNTASSNYSGELYDSATTRKDMTLREIGYLDRSYQPSIKSSNIKLSVINYTGLLASMFKLIAPKYNQLTNQFNTDKITSNARIVIQYLIDKGLNVAAACGIAGNIFHESSFNTAAVGDNNTSFGICQWHQDRGVDMKSMVGPNWSTNLTGQMDYLWYELSSDYRFSTLIPLQKVKNTLSGCKGAADIFVRQFEKPADVDIKSVQRQETAASYFNQIISLIGSPAGSI